MRVWYGYTLLVFALCGFAGALPTYDKYSRDDAYPRADGNYSRADAIQCAFTFIDYDQSGFIDKVDLERLRDESLGWLGWGKFLFAYPTSTVIKACDWDGDGKISREDARLSVDSCGTTAVERQQFMDNLCLPAKRKALHLKERRPGRF
jgi:hypothetical protein